MKNREIYIKDPDKNLLLNNGVATVTDEQTIEELRTLRYELETFVCEGEYAKGLKHILETYLANLDRPEQPGVWVSGFFGSGKSHFVKMLRSLWTDFVFPEDGATARGLARLPAEVADTLKELSTAGKRLGGLHAASGTLGAGAGDNVRLALLAMIFKSVGLPEQYPLARFVIWLRDNNFLEPVKAAIEEAGRNWQYELRNLYVSPYMAQALLTVYPDFAASVKEVHGLLKIQYPSVPDISNKEMEDAIFDALVQGGRFPLTLIALDEVQQYIGDNADRSYKIQDLTEACCKKFAGRLLFVATGQTALTGTPLLQKLQGRFPFPIELSDTDVETVIRQVILAKKSDQIAAINKVMADNQGEISRHLMGTKLEHRSEDSTSFVLDYPLLPVRRRFWERTLRSVDQAGTTGQLRNQLKVVHEAAQRTADLPLGHVVAGDFIFGQIATNLLQTGVLPKEIDEQIKKLLAGSDEEVLQGRLCGLIFLINKLPREGGADLGVRATPDVLADLLVEDLLAGSAELRKRIPPLLEALVDSGLLMVVGDEYRLQTKESSAWNAEYVRQLATFNNNPQMIASKRAELFQETWRALVKPIALRQGQSKVARDLHLHFAAELPKDADQKIYVWVRDGWDDNENSVIADARAAGNQSPTIFIFIPRQSADELKNLLASYHASEATVFARGTPKTIEAHEAQQAMQTRQAIAQTGRQNLVGAIFKQVRIFNGGGQEISGTSVTEMLLEAANNSLARLYRFFNQGDHDGWSRVIEQARKGDGNALAKVGHQGDPPTHPVCAALLKYVAAGKKGNDIRKEFDGPPYGWPRDAIDGGLYILLVSGHLRALDVNHNPVEAANLERTKITQINFRVEAVTIPAGQRLQIRRLLQDASIPCIPNEELVAIPQLLATMKEWAREAGGEPPCPLPPDTKHLEKIAQLTGNEQLLEVFNQKDVLVPQIKDWPQTGATLKERRKRWENLNSLLSQAAGLPPAADLQKQVQAISNGRMLMDTPDPVPGLCDRVTQILRQALVQAQADFRQVYETEEAALQRDANWQKLNPQQQQDILATQGLTGVPPIATGTEAEVLQSLNAISLGTWKDRREALPNRFAQARLAAAKLLEPTAVRVSLPSGTLHDEAEARKWLSQVEEMVLEQLKTGPVVV
jgi:hypothetical protein